MSASAVSPLRTAVRVCRRSVRAGAFACELATRRRWLGARDAQWVAENVSALRGFSVDVSGTEVPGGEADAFVLADGSAAAALVVLAAVPSIASVGPSLLAHGEPWWPRGNDAPWLLSSADRAELDRVAGSGGRVVPVGVRFTPPVRGLLRGLWPVRAGSTQVELRFGPPFQLGDGADLCASVRGAIERLLSPAA